MGLRHSLVGSGGEDYHSKESGQVCGIERRKWWGWSICLTQRLPDPTWVQVILCVGRRDDGTVFQSGSQKSLGEARWGRWRRCGVLPTLLPLTCCLLPTQAAETSPDLCDQHCCPPRSLGALSFHGEQPQDPGGALSVAGLSRGLPHKGVSWRWGRVRAGSTGCGCDH